MLDIGWPELIVTGAVALVVVGPKDLPRVMYGLGKLVSQARRFMHGIASQIDQLGYEAEMMDALKAKKQAEKESEQTPSQDKEPPQP